MIDTQLYVLLLFILAIFLFLIPHKIAKSQFLQYCFYGVLIIVIGLRNPRMADYNDYVDGFVRTSDLRFEPGFYIVRFIVSLFGNYVWGFISFAIISIYLKFRSISLNKELFWASTIVYLSNIVVIQDMAAIRAGVAASSMLLAINYKVEGDKRKFLLLMCVSFLFHYTAAIFLPIFFMSTQKKYKYFYLGMIFLSYFFAMSNFYLTQFIEYMPFIGKDIALFDKYVDEMGFQQEPMNIFNLLQLGHLLICLAFWSYIDKIYVQYKASLILLKVYSIGLCIVCWFAQSFVMAIRLSELFFVVEILLIPMGFSIMFDKKSNYKLLLLLYAIVIFYIRMSDYLYWDPARL